MLRDAIRSEMLTLVIEQNADLRSRLALFRDYVCEGCGCAVKYRGARCIDCCWCDYELPLNPPSVQAAACISVGMRALCGRKLLEGIEVE